MMAASRVAVMAFRFFELLSGRSKRSGETP